EAGLESGHSPADQLFRELEGSAGRRLRQCLQGAVGALPEVRRWRRLVPLESARRREGCAARGTWTQELAPAKMARRAEAETMKRDTLLSIKLPAADGRMEQYAVREPRQFTRPSRAFTRK